MGGRVRVPAAAVAAQRLGDVLLDAAEGPVGAVDLVKVETQLVVGNAAPVGLFRILKADDPLLVCARKTAQVFRRVGTRGLRLCLRLWHCEQQADHDEHG